MIGTRLAAALALLLMVTAAAPARAEITQGELDGFITGAKGRYTGLGESLDLHSVFYIAARIGKTPAGAVRLYAEVRGIPQAQAQREAELLLQIYRHFKWCRETSDRPCGLEQYPKLKQQVFETGRVDRTGFFFLSAAHTFDLNERILSEEFFNAIKNHPGLRVICLGLYGYHRGEDLLVPLLAADVPDVWAAGHWVLRNEYRGQARSLALLERAWRRIGEHAPRSADHAFLTTLLIGKLLVSAQTDEALRIYNQYPYKEQLWDKSIVPDFNSRQVTLAEVYEKLYALLPGEEPNEFQLADESDRRRQRAYLEDLIRGVKIDLAAAMLVNDRDKEAAAMLDKLSMAELHSLGLYRRQQVYFLREIMTPSLALELTYDVFMRNFSGSFSIHESDWVDTVSRYLPPIIEESYSLLFGRMPGWLSVADPPPFDELGAAYLSDAGYPTMARYLLSGEFHRERPKERITFKIFADQLGSEFFARAEYYKERLEQTEAEREEKIRTLQKEIAPTPVHISERPVVFEERPLPDGIEPFTPPRSELDQTGEEKEKKENSPLPEGVELPVRPYQVVRLEKTGKEWTLIFLSHALDPVGEVSRGGYWVVRSRAHGHGWETPVYLGLQQFIPYVVTPESKLPLMDGDVLQIEVQVRELDTESISFPPIGLRAKRRQDGLYLRFEWDALTRDSDSDGLTDLAEHRMGLHPQNPDTDGDGLFDGSDSLPLTPFRLREPEENELAIQILQQILGYERQAIITGLPAAKAESLEDILKSALGPRPAIDPMHTTFMLADPGIFTGIRLRTRLLVYGPGAAERLENQYGIFYPVGVQWVFSNKSGTKHHVIWSASWTGGEFLLIRKEAGYKVIHISQWVT